MTNESPAVIPATPYEITPAWMSDILREIVTEIKVQPIGEGIGFGSRTARLHLSYERQAHEAPDTLFLKLTPSSAGVRERQRMHGIHECEAGFYREAAAQIGLRVPKPYLSVWKEQTGESVVLIEDVSHAKFGDNLTSCSDEDTRLVLSRLAAFHGHWWKNPQLAEFQWLRSFAHYAECGTRLYRTMLELRRDAIADFVPDVLVQAAINFGDRCPAWFEQLSQLPGTFVHGDTRLDNFAFEPTPSGTELIVFDWQLARVGPAALDVAYFLVSSLSAESRRAAEGDLLKFYHSELLRHGVTGYSFEDLRQDYRLGIGKLLMVLVSAVGLLNVTHERARALARELTNRVSAAIDDHDFREVLNPRHFAAGGSEPA